MKILLIGIDRKHTGAVADSQHLTPGQFPVYIPLQCDQVINLRHMRLFLQNRLVQMGDAPSLRDMVLEQLRQLFRSLLRHGISPGTERHQDFSCLIESHIAVHHGGNANGADGRKRHTVACFYILRQLCKAVLNALPDVL